MHRILIIALFFFIPVVGEAQVSGSYQRLKGKRLSKFLSTQGQSEKGRHVSFYLPGRAIPLKNSSSKRTQRFTFKKLPLVVATNNPYLIQTRRKLGKSTKGQVLVKGQVRQSRRVGRKITHYLFVDTMQKIGGRTKSKRKRKKS